MGAAFLAATSTISANAAVGGALLRSVRTTPGGAVMDYSNVGWSQSTRMYLYSLRCVEE